MLNRGQNDFGIAPQLCRRVLEEILQAVLAVGQIVVFDQVLVQLVGIFGDGQGGDVYVARSTVAGYGAAQSSTTLIYHFGLGNKLSFLVDDDPYRQNLVSPGYHIPVMDSQALSEQKPDYVLIMAPLYAEQIIAKNQAYLDQGGQFMAVWPKIEIR